MRRRHWLTLLLVTALSLVAGIALALFTNGDFETGTFSGWSQSTFLNDGLTGPPNGPFTGANITRTAGGSNQSAIVTAAAPETGIDPQLGPTASLMYPKFGLNCARVNYTTTGKNANSMAQITTTTAADVDAVDGKVHVRFAYAPVLQDPSDHAPFEKPYFYISLKKFDGFGFDLLYETFVFSGEPGVPWKTSPLIADVKYMDWRVVDFAPGAPTLGVGDLLLLEVVAAGCSKSGHFGYVYVDGFGSEIPGLSVVKTASVSPVTAGKNFTYTFTYKNGGSATVDNVVVNETIPDCATFVSTSQPSTGGTCSYASGVVTCNLGSLAPAATGTFVVTVAANPDTTGCPLVANGNYSISGTGVSPTLGPPVNTPLVMPCSPLQTLVINSGWDQMTGQAIAMGGVDNEWTCVSDPPIIAATTEPRPAFTIAPHSAWSPAQANSRWISSFPTASDDTNGHYVFEYRFCLASNVGAGLNVSLRADDQASVYLNGNFMGSTGAHSFDHPPLVVVTNFLDWGKFNAGENVLRVDVENVQKVAMGFNLVGTITGQVPQYHYCCTDAAGGMLGTVFQDPNSNGVKDSGESPRAGWTVNLLQGATVVRTTTSDGLGHYYFLGLTPGTYTADVVSKGFVFSTTPTAYTVALGLGEIVSGLDFGSRKATYRDAPPFPIDDGFTRIEPNPFNPEATITFSMTAPSPVTLRVYDVAGRLVRTLVNESLVTGEHTRDWDGRDDAGRSVASGVYFVRLVTNKTSQTYKVMLLK